MPQPEGGAMPTRLAKFVQDQNIKNFTRQLEIETDPDRVAQLKTLLKEELARALPLKH